MSYRTDLLDALLRECDICTHLYGKLPDGGLEYRPTAGQRNTLELLRYISHCGLSFLRAMVSGDWEQYSALAEASEKLAPEDFPAAMEEQKRLLIEDFAALTDEDMFDRSATGPAGEEMTLGRAILDMPFRCLSGYRMQLFLYAKAAGNHELNTPNCWFGVDMKM